MVIDDIGYKPPMLLGVPVIFAAALCFAALVARLSGSLLSLTIVKNRPRWRTT